jgi:hypothetical protein
MARKRKHSVVQIAMSPFACADACSVSYERTILPAIAAGELPVFTNPRGKSARRILVSDLERWIRATWSQQLKRSR